MPLRYRDNMTLEEANALLAEAHHLDLCYAEADSFDAAHAPIPGDDEECECFDPIRDGWVGKDGRP
jgi:hypothetical protein